MSQTKGATMTSSNTTNSTSNAMLVGSSNVNIAGGNAAGATPFVSPSLYVGDLHPDVTETMLFEVFNSVGHVHSIRVCRDNVTRKSLGYAYVNYQSLQDAERSLDTLNYTPIKGIPCRIMWCQRDPSLRKSGNGNIFVKNLDKQIDNKALYDTFSLFGNILSCKVAVDVNGKSKGYGFVHYESDASAKSAIEKVNGMLIGGKAVYVGPFILRNERESTSELKYTNIYIKNLPKAWNSEEVLKPLLEKYGEVTSMELREDSKGRPFAFCNFENHESAKRCVDDLNDRQVTDKGLYEGGDIPKDNAASNAGKDNDMTSTGTNNTEEIKRTENEDENTSDENKKADSTTSEDAVMVLYVGPHQSKAQRNAMLKAKFEQLQTENRERYQGNLYIKNMDSSIDDDKLFALFEPFGQVTSAKVMRDDKGISKGFGFVCFMNSADATKAVNDMHLKHIKGKPLYVGMAEKREHRIQRLQQRFRINPNSNNPNLRANPNMQNIGMNGSNPGLLPPMPFSNAPNHMPYGASNNMPVYGAGGPRPLMGYNHPSNPNAPNSIQPGLQHVVHWRHGSNTQFNNNNPGVRQLMNPLQQLYTNPSGGNIQNRNNASGGPRNAAANATPGRSTNNPASTATMTNATNVSSLHAGANKYNNTIQSVNNVNANAKQHGSFKFTPQVRNQRLEQQNHHGGQASNIENSASGTVMPNNAMVGNSNQSNNTSTNESGPLTAAALAAAQPSMQKQMLGERLFPMISRYQPELAGKITGMMLEMDNSELLILLESDVQLKAKVDEALGVLRQAN